MELTTQDRTTLREFLENHFSLDEIETLAFDLGLPKNAFRCGHLSECVREFISWCERRGEICDLLKKVTQARPNFPMPLQLLQKYQTSSPPVLNIIKQLAAKLEIPVKNIVLCNHSRKTMLVYVSFDEATYTLGAFANKFKLFDTIENQQYNVRYITEESEHYFLLSKKSSMALK